MNTRAAPASIMTREFAVPPPDWRKAWLLPVVAMFAAVVGLTLAAHDEPRTLLMLPLLLIPVALITATMRRRRVLLRDDELVVHAGLNSRRVPVGGLDLAQARIVDLAEHTGLQPMFKTFGTALPGYRSGHFRLRDRSRAFVLLTGARRVLVLTEQSGRRLLLGVEKPQALLDALLVHPGTHARELPR